MLVNVVLDRSGSMDNIRKGTIDGYNEYINGLKKDTASEYFISLIQFDTNGHNASAELTISYIDKPLAEVPVMTMADYEPRGGTPLYDAIGECVRRVDQKDRAVTVVIITDGQENSSREFTADAIKKLRAEKEAEGWTFVFIGADFDAYSAGSTVGMSAMNSVSYKKGMESNLYAAVAQSTVIRSLSNATMGIGETQCHAFFDDSQKLSVGDPTVTFAGASTGTGGGSATTTFRPNVSIKTPMAGKQRQPREWSETVSK